MGNVQLEVTVEEQATGYVEKTTHLVTVAATPVSLQVIPEVAQAHQLEQVEPAQQEEDHQPYGDHGHDPPPGPVALSDLGG
jgi:hypothetical protein